MATSTILSGLSVEIRNEITKELTVESSGGIPGYAKDVTIYPFSVEDDTAYIPFYYGNQKLKKFPNDSKKYSVRNIGFTGELREYQLHVVKDAIDRINNVRCVFISMATGKGKTLTSIYVASRLKVKTMVYLHRVNLFEQWTDTLKKVIPNVKIQVLDSKVEVDPDNDFYLINPINVLKRDRKDFDDIGFLIADEAHALCSEQFSKSLLYVCPKYCVGLSATPDRSDGLDKIISLHFGAYRINVPLFVEHNYYKFVTGLVPEVKRNIRGDMDWNSVLEYQANHVWRNLQIVRVCQMFQDRNILVLCKRKIQTETLYKMLLAENESVDYTTGTKKKYNKDARILTTTYSKSGVGFDHPKLDMLIVASDVDELFEQYFGRCVRREDTTPIVVDFVDILKSLENHYRSRRKYALSVGGKEKDFHREFPLFKKESEIVFV